MLRESQGKGKEGKERRKTKGKAERKANSRKISSRKG